MIRPFSERVYLDFKESLSWPCSILTLYCNKVCNNRTSMVKFRKWMFNGLRRLSLIEKLTIRKQNLTVQKRNSTVKIQKWAANKRMSSLAKRNSLVTYPYSSPILRSHKPRWREGVGGLLCGAPIKIARFFSLL